MEVNIKCDLYKLKLDPIPFVMLDTLLFFQSIKFDANMIYIRTLYDFKSIVA